MATQQQQPNTQFGFAPKPSVVAAGASGVSLRGDLHFVSPIQMITATTEATAGNVTHTAEEVLGGLILRDCAGGARTDTLPTAALLVSACKGAVVGTGIRLIVRNTSDAAETITMAMGTDITSVTGNLLTVAQNSTAEYLIVFTSVTPGAEAANLYTLSSNVHNAAI